MPFEGVRRATGELLATLGEIGHTRLELATLELEEERLRLGRLLILAGITLFLCGVGLVFAAVFLVMLVDPQWRVHTLGGITVALLVAAALVWRQWRTEARNKPPLLADTLAEIERDLRAFTAPPHGPRGPAA